MCAFAEFLIIFSIVLIMIEIILSTGGILAFSGIVSFFISLILIAIWHIPVPTLFLEITIPTFIILFALCVITIILAWKAHKKEPIVGENTLIGKTAKCVKEITKDKPGLVEVGGELWTAIADEEIKQGDIVIIVDQESLKLKVKKGV